MANIELNIVALGDFSSVNAQIKALQAQVALLQQGMAGVGVNSTLAKDLNNITNSFKQTMLSTGQFTASTVKMATETEKFGQALQKGSLGIGNYFNILTNRASSATSSVKALAVEQTKLQNSVIMSDPTKQGFYSVFTPTTINAVANATKIAANEQNIYNIAVEKGSQALINWGKNTQWAGRQLTVGMSMPLILFGQQAIASFDSVNKAITQLQKVYGEGLTPPSQNSINQISQQVLDLGRNMASTLGITQEFTVQVASSFAAMGKMGTDLTTATEQTVRLAKLGNLDQQTATSAVIALQNVYKLNTTQLSDAVNYFGAIQKQTSLSMNDLVSAESRVGPIIDQLGGSYKDTSVMLLAMKEAGVPAAQAANALKSAFGSIIAPTAAANKEFQSFGISLDSIKNAGGPVQMIQALQASLQNLSPLVREQLIEKLFGKYQFARISALIENFGKVGSQTANAIKVANASSQQIQNLANQELTQATSTPSAQWTKAMATIKADLYPVGQKLIEFGTKILQFGNGIAKLFQGLPGPVKAVMGALAIGVALSGPIIMLTGLFANFVGYVIKGIFNLKQLATGGKTLGQLLTPEMIAAQNASKLFGDGIASDVEEIDLLNTAIKQLTVSMQELIASMNQGAGISTLTEAVTALDSVATAEAGIPAAIRNIPFKAPGMATGGYVPGSGNSDTFPAMLTPGEAVIPKEQAQKYGPFIGAMISGNLPGYAVGTQSTFGEATFVKPGSTSAPSEIAKLANYIIGPQLEAIRAIIEKLNLTLNPKQINDMVTADAAHIQHATTPEGHKAWQLSNLTAASGAENKALEYLAGEGKARKNIRPHWQDSTDKIMNAMLDATSDPTAIEEIKKTAARVRIGSQPINEFEGKFMNAVMADMQEKVKAGIVPKSSTTINYLPAAKAISDARLNGDLPSYESLTYKANEPEILAAMAKSGKDAEMAAREAAAQYIAALKAGIEAGTVTVEEAVSDLVAKGLSAGQAAAEIASPSGLFRRMLGLPLAQGAAQGVVEGTPELEAAVTQSVEAAATAGEEAAVKSGGILGRATNFMSGGAMGGGVAGGMGAGMTAMMMGQMASPLLKNIPGIGGAASAGVGDAASTFGLVSMIPGVGMQAKLALTAVAGGFGIVKSAISSFVEAEKQRQAELASSFTASSDAITMFGGSVNNASTNIIAFTAGVKETAPELTALQQNVQAIAKLAPDNPFKLMAKDLKSMGDASSVIGTLKQFAATQVMNGMDPAKVKDMITALLSYTGQTQYLKAALDEILPATNSVSAATESWFQKMNSQMGTIDLTATKLSQLSQIQQQYGKGLLNLVTTQIESGGTALQIKTTYDMLTQSIQDQAGAYQALILAAQNAQQTGLATSLALSQSMGLSVAQATILAEVTQAKGTPTDPKSVAAALSSTDKITSLANDFERKAHASAQEAATTAQVAVNQQTSLQSLQQQKKVIDAQLKDEKDKEASIKAQNQFLLSQTDIDNQIRTAVASGNFLQAALLRQQKASNAYDYSTSQNVSPLQAKSDKLATQIAAVQDAMSGTALKQQQDAATKLQLAADNFVPGSQNFKDAVDLLVKILTGIAQQLGVNPNGVGTVATGNQVKESPTTFNPGSDRPTFKDNKGNPITKPGTPFAAPSGSIPVKSKYSGRSLDFDGVNAQVPQYTDQMGRIFLPNGNVWDTNKKAVIGRWWGVDAVNPKKVVAYSTGGMVNGPGSWTSDSIPAMLSDGEFVTSASAVSKYGVSFMNSINNGSYRPSIPNMAGASSLALANSGTVGGSVYNITVNAQTSANTDEIVKAVVNSVKRLEGMSSSNRTVRV